MGHRSRTRRPNRMARLRLIVYLVLALSAHVNVSNSMTQARTPKRRQEDWMKARVSHPEVPSKATSSHPEVHSIDTVSCPEVHYKAAMSQIFDNALRLDRHSNQLAQTSGLYVKDCPSDCYCELMTRGNQTSLAVFNCKYDPYDALPKLINSHRNTTQLQLINCHLSRLPAEILKLPLNVVALDMNEFTEVPRELLELPQLLEVWMESNKLSSLPADVTKWSALTWLDLSHNMIAELPQGIGRMRKLHTLNLTHNALQSLPQTVGGWSQLQYLLLLHNNLESLPPSIGALSQLLRLDVRHNKLTSLPAEVGNLTKLQGLRLSNNQLKTLPPEIRGLTTLFYIELQDNEVRILPSEISTLRKLEALYVSNNPLVEVPALPTESLAVFNCSNCSIQTLPCTLFTEGHMKILWLSYNNIKTVDCGQIYSYYISQLILRNNSLQEIPCDSRFASMKSFSVSYNNISTLPKKCELLNTFMEEIFCHYNRIDVLYFSSFCPMEYQGFLRYVGFGYNRIRTIDTSDSPLQKCFRQGALIQLSGNMLSTLDSWPMLLSQNKSITLDVSGNNLSAFTNSGRSILHASQYGSVFIMQWNQIKYFMDVFNGWNLIVNTTEGLNTVLKNAYFDLGHNPLVCDCVDYEVYRYIQTLTSEQYGNLVCHEPKSLRGQNPHHIPLGHFVCDVDVNCPSGCTCTKVPHSQSINVTCLSYNETDIPGNLPNLPTQNYEYRLDICHQNLHEISFRPYLMKTTEIRFSNNSVTSIKINSSHVFQRLKILHVDNNRLQRLPESVSGMTNESIVEIRLGSNPWVCDCKAMAMKTWIMQNWHIVKDKEVIRCHSPQNMIGVKVMNIERSMVCPSENKTPAYVVAVISSAVFIFFVYIYIYDKLKLRNWRLVGSDECDGEFKEFDIFMCACSDDSDADYVENFLIPELESRDFRVLYHREHFHPGKPIHVNMSEALEKSKRTLVFFSNSFRDSGYSMFEFHSALDLDIRNKRKRLITIKDTDLEMDKLEISEVRYFEYHTYVDREDVKFWTLLESALPRKRLGAQVRL